MSSYWYCCECRDGGHGFGTSSCPSCFHSKCGCCITENDEYASSALANNSQSHSLAAAASTSITTTQHVLAHSHLLTHLHPINATIIGNLNPCGDKAPTDGGKQYRWVCHECGGDNSCTYSKRCTSGNCHHAYEGCSQCDIYVIET